MSQLSEVQQERCHQVRFAYRDGWLSGFICGIFVGTLVVAVAALLTIAVTRS